MDQIFVSLICFLKKKLTFITTVCIDPLFQEIQIKYIFSSIWSFLFSGEKSVVCQMVAFPPWLPSKFFLLQYSFQQFDYDVFGCGIFLVYPVWDSWSFLILKLCISTKFTSFSAIISSTFFFFFGTSLFHLSFQNSVVVKHQTFGIVPQVPEAQVILIFNCFSIVQMDNFY